jgi:8-oxo-dGTP pyrophosphatase MutT (NUDIX family)
MTPNAHNDDSARPRRKVQVHVYFRPPGSAEPLFLVLQRPPSRGGIWQPITGSVDDGETFEEGARREVREETGIGRLRDLCELHQFEFEKNGRVFVETVYVACAEDDAVLLSGEHDMYRWVPAVRAREMFHFDSNRAGLDAAVARILDRSQ